MNFFVSLSCLFFTFSIVAQAGINTTNPSPAAVLEVNSSSDGVNFGGFMPPRVTLAERDDIPVTAADEGLMVYVINPPSSQLQIWDGIAWQTLFPQSVEFSTVLAAWEMSVLLGGTGNYGPSPFDASDSSASVSVGGLIRGSGLTTTGDGAANAWGANGWLSGLPTENQANAIATNKFVTFTITPNFGVNASLTIIEPYNIRRSGTGPTTGIWQYSINGGSFIDIGTEISWGGVTSGAGNPQIAIDLSGIGDLQNLTSTTTVTFRIVNWGASAAGGTWYINDQVAGPDLIIRGNLN